MDRAESLARRVRGALAEFDDPDLPVVIVVGRLADRAREAAAALEAAREDACVALVADIRRACDDNFLRMGPELVEYIRELAEDAERYRWLRDREIPEWLDLWHQNPDRIDAAIDRARGKEVT